MAESLRDDLGMVQEQLERLMAGQLSLTQKLDHLCALLQPTGQDGGIPRPQEHRNNNGAKYVPSPTPTTCEAAGDVAPDAFPILIGEARPACSERSDIPPSPDKQEIDIHSHNPPSKSFKIKEHEKLRALVCSAEEAEENLKRETEYHETGVGHKFMRHHLEMFDSKENFVHWLDSWMGLIISANAVFIGVSVDYENSENKAWLVINVCFCCLFWVELLTKLMIYKPLQHFCGNDRVMNVFDASLVLIDTLQLGLAVANQDNVGGLPDASLFRIVRLLRLLRLVRLSRSDAAKDLVNMLTGLLGGIKTLMWSLGLFVITMYVAALVFQEALGGKSNPEHIRKYFASTPRSMFTVFRCSFGDCSDEGGTPIFEHVNDNYGAFFALLLCVFLFFVVVGLFNVISAVFVESTLSAAEKMQSEKKTSRLQDESLFAIEMANLLRMLLEEQLEENVRRHPSQSAEFRLAHDTELQLKLSDRMEEVMRLDMPCATINKMAKDSKFREALNRLDIEPEDHQHLSSILDPDGSGSIDALEFVSGVERLRGMPRRSDVVSVQLMIRSLQEKVEELPGLVLQLLEQHKALPPGLPQRVRL